MQQYHRLFVSPEHYDRLSDLGGSGGATAIKGGGLNDSADDNSSQVSPGVHSPEDTEQGTFGTLFRQSKYWMDCVQYIWL